MPDVRGIADEQRPAFDRGELKGPIIPVMHRQAVSKTCNGGIGTKNLNCNRINFRGDEIRLRKCLGCQH